jgi:hypothetical protein
MPSSRCSISKAVSARSADIQFPDTALPAARSADAHRQAHSDEIEQHGKLVFIRKLGVIAADQQARGGDRIRMSSNA